MANQIKIKLKRSLIGSTEKQIKVVNSLGLKKLNQVVEQYDTPVVMGMVNKVSHLVEIVK
ncbi:50S ribosomal protein L30 [bacterium]|nr:50S ribosomal protein L30 [bacterium]